MNTALPRVLAFGVLAFALGLSLLCCQPEQQQTAAGGGAAAAPQVIRLGHFPNITHAHGLVAHSTSREGKGFFEQRLGGDVVVEWFVYNAGPSAMEAILAGTLDATYVGPNPAVNAHVKSDGEEVRVIAGATSGGAARVVQGDGRIRAPADFRGRRVATPQLGNTQDVACRSWLAQHGFKVTQTGGDVTVVPTQNPDQLALFLSGELDAVWTVEPWVSRLELEANGTLLVEEKDAVTTVLVASRQFLAERPELARRLVAAHAELTAWLQANQDESKRRVSAELAAETTQPVPPALLERCWPRMRFTDRVALAEFESFARAAVQAGFLKQVPDLSRLVEVVQ